MDSRFVAAPLTLATLTLILAACSSTKTVPGQPQPGAYQIDFPDISAAVAAKSVTIYVFDQNDSSSECVSLLQTVRSGAVSNLPAAIQTITTSACGLDAADAGALAVPFGNYAVLAVAAKSQGGTAFLSGCVAATVTAQSPSVTITLGVVSDTISIPPTNCTGLQAACANTCT